jgi:hypothetical protein
VDASFFPEIQEVTLVSPVQALAEQLDFARLAPLSARMIFHLIGEDLEVVTKNVDEHASRLLPKITDLWQRVELVRKEVFQAIRKTCQESTLNSLQGQQFQLLFQEQVEKKREILAAQGSKLPQKNFSASRPTLRDWEIDGKLRRDAHHPRRIEMDWAGAALISFAVDGRIQGFLPEHVDQAEPYWWCYAQHAPKIDTKRRRIFSAPFIVPVPLPDTLEPATVLWSPWTTLRKDWLPLDDMGAIRFVDAILLRNGEVQWRVPHQLVEAWDPGRTRGRWLTTREGHAAAEAALFRLARHFFLGEELS